MKRRDLLKLIKFALKRFHLRECIGDGLLVFESSCSEKTQLYRLLIVFEKELGDLSLELASLREVSSL